jgi:hypothetical protein
VTRKNTFGVSKSNENNILVNKNSTFQFHQREKPRMISKSPRLEKGLLLEILQTLRLRSRLLGPTSRIKSRKASTILLEKEKITLREKKRKLPSKKLQLRLKVKSY